MDWRAIQSYHLAPPEGVLPRTPAVQKAYEDHIAAVKLSDCSIGSYIRKRYMGGERAWAFVPNQFPYAFVDGTQHWLLWFDEKKDPAIDTGAILAECGVKTCVIFGNLIVSREIPRRRRRPGPSRTSAWGGRRQVRKFKKGLQ